LICLLLMILQIVFCSRIAGRIGPRSYWLASVACVRYVITDSRQVAAGWAPLLCELCRRCDGRLTSEL